MNPCPACRSDSPKDAEKCRACGTALERAEISRAPLTQEEPGTAAPPAEPSSPPPSYPEGNDLEELEPAVFGDAVMQLSKRLEALESRVTALESRGAHEDLELKTGTEDLGHE